MNTDRRATAAILAAAAILMVTQGVRLSMGLFVSPLNTLSAICREFMMSVWSCAETGNRYVLLPSSRGLFSPSSSFWTSARITVRATVTFWSWSIWLSSAPDAGISTRTGRLPLARLFPVMRLAITVSPPWNCRTISFTPA